MRPEERKHLKQNEFVSTTVRVVEAAQANQQRLMLGAGILVVLVLAFIGYRYIASRGEETASAALAIAMSIEQAQIAPPATLPGATQPAGTYPSEQARLEAALKAFTDVAVAHPGTKAGLTAKYHSGITNLALGKFAEAGRIFEAVTAEAGNTVYGDMAKLGRAEALLGEGKTDDAIKAFTDLSALRDSALPVDGVLMQLARACLKGGKTAEARAAFKRVVDEFPDSPYTGEAREQLAAIS